MSRTVDDPLLDHSYDGIQEYDNPLPGWWKLIFYVSILFALPYTIYYHVMPGNSIQEQFEADMAANELMLGLEADPATILALRDDPEKMDLISGKFATLCLACHTAEGTGVPGLGPNLTDHYWKNVDSLDDIYKVLKEGVPGTAMVSQTSSLNQDELVLMAAFVARLSLNPKEGLPPEGDEIKTWPAELEQPAAEPESDSSPETPQTPEEKQKE